MRTYSKRAWSRFTSQASRPTTRDETPFPGIFLVGETGFEPATARPPARGMGSLPVEEARAHWVGCPWRCGSCAQFDPRFDPRRGITGTRFGPSTSRFEGDRVQPCANVSLERDLDPRPRSGLAAGSPVTGSRTEHQWSIPVVVRATLQAGDERAYRRSRSPRALCGKGAGSPRRCGGSEVGGEDGGAAQARNGGLCVSAQSRTNQSRRVAIAVLRRSIICGRG
jgi:hypothetical protein